jgi:ferredoxin
MLYSKVIGGRNVISLTETMVLSLTPGGFDAALFDVNIAPPSSKPPAPMNGGNARETTLASKTNQSATQTPATIWKCAVGYHTNAITKQCVACPSMGLCVQECASSSAKFETYISDTCTGPVVPRSDDRAGAGAGAGGGRGRRKNDATVDDCNYDGCGCTPIPTVASYQFQLNFTVFVCSLFSHPD